MLQLSMTEVDSGAQGWIGMMEGEAWEERAGSDCERLRPCQQRVPHLAAGGGGCGGEGVRSERRWNLDRRVMVPWTLAPSKGYVTPPWIQHLSWNMEMLVIPPQMLKDCCVPLVTVFFRPPFQGLV